METEPETKAVLQSIVDAHTDEDRRVIESQNLAPYDSGLHEDDPQEQPSQDKDAE